MSIFNNSVGKHSINKTEKDAKCSSKERDNTHTYHVNKKSINSKNTDRANNSTAAHSQIAKTASDTKKASSTDNISGKSQRKRKNKRRGNGFKGILIFILIIILLALSAFGIYKITIRPPDIGNTDDVQLPVDNKNNEDDDNNGNEGTNYGIEIHDKNRKEGFYTILVACTDEDKTRTDSILAVSFDTVNKSVAIMNVPRDTMSNVTRNLRKINGAYAGGGINQLKKEITMLLGIPVDRYVVFDFNGIADIVDAIGGINFDVPVKMNYDDPTQNLHIHYNKGTQKLYGQDVVNVLRFRKNNNGSGYANADIGRIDTLQKFIKTLANTVMTPSIISKIPSIYQAVVNNTSTDLKLTEIIWFAEQALGVSSENINMHTLPGYDKSVYEPALGLNQSYWIPTSSKVLELINEEFNPYTSDIKSLNIVPVSSITRATKPTTTTKAQTSASSAPTSSSASVYNSQTIPSISSSVSQTASASVPSASSPSTVASSANESISVTSSSSSETVPTASNTVVSPFNTTASTDGAVLITDTNTPPSGVETSSPQGSSSGTEATTGSNTEQNNSSSEIPSGSASSEPSQSISPVI